MPTNPPRHEPKPAPPSLKKAGKAFWTDVLSAFTLEPHHLFVLEAAGIQLDRAGEAAKRRETAATPTEADRAEAAERAAHSLFLMPRVTRIAPNVKTDLSQSKRVRNKLTSGHDWGFPDRELGPMEKRVGQFPVDDATMAEIWSEIGAELIAEWIVKKPGSRPWAWWLYNAPEPRRIVPNGEQRFSMTTSAERTRFGIRDEGTGFETERAYLERLGLLMDAERDLKKAEG